MIISYDTISDVLLKAFVLLVIYYVLYRRYIYSVLDPVFSFTWTTAFSSVLVIEALVDQQYIIHYFACQLSLFAGFFFIQELPNLKKPAIIKFNFYDRDLLAITVYILLVIYVIANLFTLYLRGAALFNDDPYARVTNFDEGFGIFKRLNWGVGSFLCAGLTILYLTQPKRIYLFFILVLAFFTVLEGSKSSLLRIIVIVAALVYHPLFRTNIDIVNRLKKYGPAGIVSLVVFFLLVQSKESGAEGDVFLAAVRRLLYGADSVLYFYLPQNEYLRTAYHPMDFWPYLIVPITGFLKLAPYGDPFGSIMVENTQLTALKTDVYLAPNTPFYIEGQIFFGYYGAFIYSFFIGVTYSLVRFCYMHLSQSSYFVLAIMCTFFYHSIGILVEINLFITGCLDTCLFVPPVYLVVCFLVRQKIILYRPKFSF